MRTLRRLVAFLLTLSAVVSIAEGARAQTAFADSYVQPPSLAAPSRGSLAGQYAAVAFGPADVSRGGFSLPLPIAVPTERGSLPASPFPSYSPDAPLSEWGAGWSVRDLEIRRFREVGDLDWSTDALAGPWGRMVLGSDGAWYPAGLGAHVRVEQPSPDTLVAYLPDGQRWTYGGVGGTEAGSGGVYAWKLVTTESATGQRALYTYTANASGRLFLEAIDYGVFGAADAPARVTFATEPVAVPFTDYRAGKALELDRRVARVTALVRHATTGALTPRWHFDIAYTPEGLGPGFFLSSLQQTFASGESAPAITYEYETAASTLAATMPRRAEALDALIATYGTEVFQPHRSAAFDADDDGRPDLEFAFDNRTLRRTIDGFAEDLLPPASASAFSLCRRAPASFNAPRLLARMRPEDADVSVVGTSRSGTQTYVAICSREGELHLGESLVGDWQVSEKTKLVDLDRDHRPDFIRVGSGNYQILPNASSASAYAWGPVKAGALSPSVSLSASWVHDMNGDGLPDIVGRVGASLLVWYNKGNLEFETQGKPLNFRSPYGSFPNASAYETLLFDANSDGLTDVLLYKTASALLFINTGEQLWNVQVPAMMGGFGFARPAPLDLVGSGETELAFTNTTNLGYTLALTAPGTGLLKRADDGRGNVLVFDYARAEATPGIRQRPSLLHTLRIETTGHEPITYEYGYSGPKLHTRGRFLIGFDGVTRRAPLATSSMTFFNDDAHSGLLLTSVEHDDLVPGIERVAFRSYEDATSLGVAWKRLRSEGAGWRSTDPLHPVVQLEQHEVLGYEREVCPSTKRKANAHGVLVSESQYAQIDAFDKSLACLPKHQVITGTHADATLDFRHEAALSYDERGLLTRLATLDGSSGSLAEQEVTYSSEGLVRTIWSPGRGTTTFDYDSAFLRLLRITTPDGVVTEAERDPLTDAVRKFVVNRGSLIHEQSFRFDGQERLAKSWNNLTSGPSEALPNYAFSYRYAASEKPALVTTSALVDAASSVIAHAAELQTASGDTLASAKLIPEGWAFGALTKHLRGTRSTEGLRRQNVTDVGALDLTSLYTETTEVGRAQESVFGVGVEAVTKFHADVERSVTKALSLTDGLTITQVESDLFTSVAHVDAALRPVRSIDAGGAESRFSYDALGRVRKVVLPTGATQATTYDALGRVLQVERSGAGRVRYTYDATTNLVSSIAHYAPSASNAERTTTFTRDGIGRLTQETHRLHNDDEEIVTYFYDGATDDDPSRRDQLGFRTGVVGPGFKKRLAYRADGQARRTELVLDGFRSVITETTYRDDSTPSGATTTVLDASGAVISQVTATTSVDAFGRPSRVKLQGEPLVSYGYEAHGLLDFATFATAHANEEIVTLQRDPVTLYRTGHNLATSSHHSATSARFDRRGLVEREVNEVGAARSERTFGYTPAGYLASTYDANGDVETYAYDASGLRTAMASTVYSRSGKTLIAGTHTYTFDDLGRVVARDDTLLEYGPRGFVRVASNGHQSWSYLYDEVGQRLAKIEGGVVVAAFPADGSLLDAAHGLVEPLRIDGTIVGTLHHGASTTGETTRFEPMVADARGSRLSHGDGTATFPSPWGVREDHPDFAEAIDFASKGWDADLGTVRIGVRDYDPRIGQFLQPDPLYLENTSACVASPVDCNLYGYARNNPVSLTDPDGHDPVPAPGLPPPPPAYAPPAPGADVAIHDPAYRWTRLGFPGRGGAPVRAPAPPTAPAAAPSAGTTVAVILGEVLMSAGVVLTFGALVPSDVALKPMGEGPEVPHQIIGSDEVARRIAHDIGVTEGRATAARLGWRQEIQVPPYAGKFVWSNPFENNGHYGQGFDDILQGPNGDLMIAEYKGGTAALSDGQMSPRWLKNNIARLQDHDSPTARFWGNLLESYLKAGRLHGGIWSTPIHPDGTPGTTQSTIFPY